MPADISPEAMLELMKNRGYECIGFMFRKPEPEGGWAVLWSPEVSPEEKEEIVSSEMSGNFDLEKIQQN